MMKKKIWELGMTVLLLTGVFWLARTGARLTGADAGAGNGVVLIDSGHGGSDPGKIGIHQEKEKDINLQIAKRLKKQLEKNGVKVYMTRENDVDLSEGDGGNSKVQDLKRRCEMVRKIQPDCVLSIHQNSYTDATSRGAQVFYQATSESGKQLAAKIQETLKRDVAPDNRRQIKANADYYLLKNTTSTMVIVECGFLSNLQEAKQLQEAEYQKKVAQAIGMGVLYYLGESGETKQRKEDSNGDENTAGQSGAVWR